MRAKADTRHGLREALARELEARGWSQKKLARFLRKQDSTVSLWLSGRQRPRRDAELTRRLARFLRCSPDAVRRMTALEKARSRPGRERAALGPRPVFSLDEVKQVFLDELPTELEQLTSANRNSVAALGEKLNERGYDASEDLLKRFIGSLAEDHRLAMGEHDEWQEEGGVLIRDASGLAANEWDRHLGTGEMRAGFRKVFRRDGWIRSVIREACEKLNAAFEAAGREGITKSEMLSEIESVMEGSARPRVGYNVARALLVQLEALQMLREEGRRYRRLWELSPEFIINKTFGVVPHIRGLHMLLDGALLPPTTSGISVLIHGRPGTGKTMLALQLCASLAAEGYVALYLTAEEQFPTLKEKLSFAGYTERQAAGGASTLRRANQGFTLITATFLDEGIGARTSQVWEEKKRGSLVLVLVPNRTAFQTPESRQLRALRSTLEELKHKGIPACYVLDSIDAVSARGGRQMLEELFNLAKDRAEFNFFISEEHKAEEHEIREYLVDMVIKVGFRQRVELFDERFIEIEKCRTQNVLRGEHLLRIRPKEGIRVFTSVQAFLSVWRKRKPELEDATPESWKVDGLDLDAVLRGDVVRGDAVLLAGPPTTHKFPLGLAFLASGSQDEGPVLLISLREDEASVLRVIDTHPQLKPLLGQPQPGVALSGRRLHVLHLAPDYVSAEWFIHEVRERIRKAREAGRPYRRVLFSTLSQLDLSSPMFKIEPLLVHAFIELFKKERISSVFLQSVEEINKLPIESIFDATLVTRRLTESADEPAELLVRHSNPGNALRSPVLLERVRRDGGAWLSITASERGRPSVGDLDPANAPMRGG